MFAGLNEQGLLFTGECKVKAAGLKETIGGCDGHDFEHVASDGQIHASLDESATDAASLKTFVHCKAADFGEFGGINLQSCEADDLPCGNSHEAEGDQIAEFIGGAREQSIGLHKAVDEFFELRDVSLAGFADDVIGGISLVHGAGKLSQPVGLCGQRHFRRRGSHPADDFIKLLS